jgi:gamma-glutamylcyclotransferase (GGCT)/AIG2-like uncharacterized protein YtfP
LTPEENAMVDFLFVYGTLMRSAGHPMHRHVAAHAEYIDEATFGGRLYLVRHYPGVVDSIAPDDRVHGELHRLHSTAAFSVLDEYEGCEPNGAEPAEYVRVQRPVIRSNGAVVNAWIYLYNQPIDRLPRISSGRFLPP